MLQSFQMGVYNIRKAAEQSMRPSATFTTLKANPRYPYVGVAMSDGLLLLVSILYPALPTTLATFLLCKEALSLICYAPAGDVFVAATSSTGQFFLIQVRANKILQNLIIYFGPLFCYFLIGSSRSRDASCCSHAVKFPCGRLCTTS